MTASKGDLAVSGISADGVCVLEVPEAGEWVVSATLGDRSSLTQTVTVVDRYTASLSYLTPLGELAVGSSVYVNVNGTPSECIVVQQGLPSDIYDSSCDGTWLWMRQCRTQGYWQSSSAYVHGFDTSAIMRYCKTTLIGQMDSYVQSVVKTVCIPYRPESGSDVRTGSSGYSTKAFPLSATEFGCTTFDNQLVGNEGVRLAYFSADTAGNALRIATVNGNAVQHWTRTPYSHSTASSHCVSTAGALTTGAVSDQYYYSPAFILPPTVYVTDDRQIVEVD